MAPKRLRVLATDFGNYELKFCNDGNSPRAIRSAQYRLPKGVHGLMSKPNSPLIEFPDGTRFHFGTQVFKYQSRELTVVQDKSLLARLHLYACLDESGDYHLVTAHHSPHEYRDALKLALKGHHSFKRNGVSIAVTITDLDVVAEGVGSYWLAKELGLIPESGHTIVIDIGGGTWLSRVYDCEGDEIASHVADRMGVYHLATQIASDERLKAQLRPINITAPDVALVMDGFLQKHRYGETAASWAEWLDEYLDPWYRGIFGTIKAQYAVHMPFVRRFIVTGGGAHLIAHKVVKSSAFVVLPDPNFANVQGMYRQFVSVVDLAAIA